MTECRYTQKPCVEGESSRLVHGLSRLKYVQDLIIYQGLDFFPIKKQLRGAGEMANQLRSLAARPEDLGSTPITHMAAPNCM